MKYELYTNPLNNSIGLKSLLIHSTTLKPLPSPYTLSVPSFYHSLSFSLPHTILKRHPHLLYLPGQEPISPIHPSIKSLKAFIVHLSYYTNTHNRYTDRYLKDDSKVFASQKARFRDLNHEINTLQHIRG